MHGQQGAEGGCRWRLLADCRGLYAAGTRGVFVCVGGWWWGILVSPLYSSDVSGHGVTLAEAHRLHVSVSRMGRAAGKSADSLHCRA